MRKADTSDYYPTTPGSSCEPEEDAMSLSEPQDVPESREVQETWVTAVSKEGQESQEAREPRDDGKEAAPNEAQRVADRLANVLSWVLVPLMMPLYATILIFHLSLLQFAPSGTKWAFCLIVFGITAVIPMTLILMMKRMGIIQDIGLNGRKERWLPYLVSILSLAGAGWFMLAKGGPLWSGMFFFGGALAGVVNLLVNFRWKISAHAAAAAGMVALLVCISREGIPHPHIDLWICGAILLAGLLGSARVWLGRHTVLQVFAGSAVGFLCVFFLTLI